MGPSIAATAFTTILSAVVMLFTVITFFQKFALILFFTVIMASIGSFIFLCTLLDCIGPSDPTYLFDKCAETFLNGSQRSNTETNTKTKKNGNGNNDSSDSNDIDLTTTMENTDRTNKI
jgi:hypothetical protein